MKAVLPWILHAIPNISGVDVPISYACAVSVFIFVASWIAAPHTDVNGDGVCGSELSEGCEDGHDDGNLGG